MVSSTTGTHHDVEIDGTAHHFVSDDGSIVRAPMPGVVVSVCVAPGDQVDVGDRGGRRREHEARDRRCRRNAGRVRQVLVSANVQVPAGAILVRLDEDATVPTVSGTRSGCPPCRGRAGTPAERCDANLLTLSNLLIGYDVDPADALAAAEDEADVHLALGADPDVLRREIDLVTLFADLRVLFRNRHDLADDDFPVRSPQEHFFAYLRSLDADREGLPARFVADLRRALAHYRRAVARARPDPAGRAVPDLPVRSNGWRPICQCVVAVLDRWLHAVEPLTDTSDRRPARVPRPPHRGDHAPPPRDRRPGP